MLSSFSFYTTPFAWHAAATIHAKSEDSDDYLFEGQVSKARKTLQRKRMAKAGHFDIISVLLANGADPSKMERGDALHAAAEQGCAEIFCLLIKLEHWESNDALTAQQIAQRNGHLRWILRALRKKDDWSQMSKTAGSRS